MKGKDIRKLEDEVIEQFKKFEQNVREFALAIHDMKSSVSKRELLEVFENNFADFFPDIWDSLKPKRSRRKSIEELKLEEIGEKELAKKFEAAGYRDRAAKHRRKAEKARKSYLEFDDR